MAGTKSPLIPEDAETMRALGELLFGQAWQRGLARATAYSQGLLWEVSHGRQPMTPRLRARLRGVVIAAEHAEPQALARRAEVLAEAKRRFQ